MVDLLFFLFKFAAWLFLLIGTGTMLVGAGYLLHLAWRLKHAQTADGMIVGFVQKTDYWSKVHYLPQVCFTCRGQEYTITSSVSIQAEAYGLGRKVQVFFPPQNEKQLTANSFGISFCALFQCQNLIQHMLCRLRPDFQNCQNTAFSAYQLFQAGKRSICSL
mgnify:CR=1 FL=1